MHQHLSTNHRKSLELIPFYVLLHKYYLGELNPLSQDVWNELVVSLSQEDLVQEQDIIVEGLQLIASHDVDNGDQVEFEFNRLFVGPGQLLAPPYESYYRNQFKTLMQQETLAVREFYAQSGVEITAKNIHADDFIGFELEFILYMLEKSIEDHAYMQRYRLFLDKHMSKWCEQHSQLILSHAEHPICKGMALILQGIMEHEKKSLDLFE